MVTTPECPVGNWCMQTSNFQGITLRGIWSNATNAHVVGDKGTILKSSDSALTDWIQMAVPEAAKSKNLNDIWGSSATDIYAVGDDCTFLHYDGNDWHEESIGAVTCNGHITAISGLGTSLLWFVTSQGDMIYRYGDEEKEWGSKVPVLGKLNDVHVNESGKIVVVADGGQIYFFSDYSDNNPEKPTCSSAGDLKSVIYLVTRWFAGGSSFCGSENGYDWSSESSIPSIQGLKGFTAIEGPPADFFAVATNGLLKQYSPKPWASVPRAFDNDTYKGTYYGIGFAPTPSPYRIIAAGEDGRISAVKKVDEEDKYVPVHAANLHTIFGWEDFGSEDPKEIYVASAGGKILSKLGSSAEWTTFSPTPTPDRIYYGIWGIRPGDFFVGTDTGVVHFKPNSWEEESGVTGTYKAIWGLADRVFAAGKDGSGKGSIKYRAENVNWSDRTPATPTDLPPLNNIWGNNNGTNIIAVGERDCIIWLHNTEFKPLTDDHCIDGPNLYAIWGDPSKASGPVYVGGDSGKICKIDGSTPECFSINQPDFSVRSLWGTSDNDIYAAGFFTEGDREGKGTIFHYYDGDWAEELSLPVSHPLNSLWGNTSNKSLFAAGDGGAILSFSSPDPGFTLTPTPTSTPTPTPTSTPAFSVSGSIKSGVAGLGGVALSLTAGERLSETIQTDAQGNFRISPLYSGETCTIRPVHAGYTFDPAEWSRTITENTSVSFKAIPGAFTVSGYITKNGGGALGGVKVTGRTTDGNVKETYSNDNGYYEFSRIPMEALFVITPSSSSYSFFPSDFSHYIRGDATKNFEAFNREYVISGRVTDRNRPVSGVKIMGGNLGNRTTSSDGTYRFPGVEGGTQYSIAPSRRGYAFTPPRIAGVVTSNQTADFKVAVRTTYGNAIQRVSASSEGAQGNGASGYIGEGVVGSSGNGEMIAFSTKATNFYEESPKTAPRGVYLTDTATGLTECVSTDASGVVGNKPSGNPISLGRAVAVSGDGTVVAYHSLASNLAPDDTNDSSDIFLYDTAQSRLFLISRTPGGAVAGGNSYGVALSGNGTSLAFSSDAEDLVEGDVNKRRDIFVWNRGSGEIWRVSVATDGTPGSEDSWAPAISGDGGRVAFVSDAANLAGGASSSPAKSSSSIIYLRDLSKLTTTRVSVGLNGAEPDGDSWAPAVSSDGKFLAFASDASNLVEGDKNGASDVFVYEVATGTISRVSVSSDGKEGSGASGMGVVALSEDGKFITFTSAAANLASDSGSNTARRQVYVHDRTTGRTGLVSRSATSAPGNKDSSADHITSDGAKVVFSSDATALVDGDTNKATDVFLGPVGNLPEIFKPKVEIEKKPDVTVKKRRVTIVMQKFVLGPSASGFQIVPVSDPLETKGVVADLKTKTHIGYAVTTRGRKKFVDRLKTKRNRVTLRNLPPGNYKVSYHAEMRKGPKVLAKTRESPRRSFMVRSR